MAQLTDTVTSLAQDVGETVANIAQDAGSAAGEFGSTLVDSGIRLLQDAGVVDKPSGGKRKFGILGLLVLIIGGAVAFKVIKGRRSTSSSPAFPEAERLGDSTGVPVG